MAVSESSRSTPRGTAGRLPREKGRELLGIALVVLGLLTLLALLSYDPGDPSLLHQTTEERSRSNWVGPVGSEVSALGFGLFGVTILLLPPLLLLGAWRLLSRRQHEAIVGRGLGAVVLVASLPPLVQLILGDLSWQGEPLSAGGALGVFAARFAGAKLGLVGALLLVSGAFFLGLALLVQRSLGQALGDLWRRLRDTLAAWRLAIERRRERKDRERSRQRVVEKHLERARRREGVVSGLDDYEIDGGARDDVGGARPPARIVEKSGAGRFSVRRRSLAELEPEAAIAGSPSPPESTGPEPSRNRRPSAPARPAATKAEPPGPRQTQIEVPVTPASLPPLNLMNLEQAPQPVAEDELVRLGEVIQSRCEEFGVRGTVDGIAPGPVITIFEFQPAPGVKVSQIVNLQDDLALSLKAEAIRIDRMAGRSTLGIEVPNHERAIIHLGPLLADPRFQKAKSPLTMAIGKTMHGEPFYGDLAKMPHLLVAGATGAGKSVGLQSMITSILYKATREDVKFIFIDPKRIELGVYADIPHLKTEVVVEPKKAANALRWAVSEMERRYKLLAEVHVRSIDFYNQAIRDPEVQKRLALRDEDQESEVALDELKPLPYYVVIIDELADLMMVSSSEVEQSIARLAQMARAVGIHLIVATQRPSVDVLTGTIKANFPCRMSFATATRHDSRTILDQVGAEKLLGKGDMLFLPPGSSRPMRLHGAYVSEQETAALIRWLKRQGKPDLDLSVLAAPQEERGGAAGGGEEQDELFDEAARLVVSEGMGSASFLQRRMRVGFSRAARLIDMLEQDGILGPAQGSKPREVLVKPDFFAEIDEEAGR